MTLKLARIAIFVRNARTTFSPHKPRQRSTKEYHLRKAAARPSKGGTEEGGALPYLNFGGGLNSIPTAAVDRAQARQDARGVRCWDEADYPRLSSIGPLLRPKETWR